MKEPSAGIWVGFAALCLGMFMAILDIQVVATSLPTIRVALAIAPDKMSWIQTAYLIAEVIAIPLTGWLTRLLTLRGLFVSSLGIFTVASIGCAFSYSFAELIAWRVLQGLAGGTLIPAVFTAVFVLFPYRAQGLATTVAGVLAMLAPTAGPLVGGWITETYSWHWLFLINVVPGVLAVVAGLLFLPREPGQPSLLRTLDWPSLLALAVSLAALELGLKEAPDRGWTDAWVIGLLGLSLLAGVAFIWRSLRAAGLLGRAIVDLSLFRDRNFAVGCAASFLLGTGLFGSVYLMPVFLAFVRDHGALRIGEIMLVTGATQLLTAPLIVALERRADARLLTALGFLLFGVGLGLSSFDTIETDFDGMFWPQVVRGTAVLLCMLPCTRLALGHFPPARVADASALFNLMRNLGGAIGLALIDTVIFGRAPIHAEALKARLIAGDASAAQEIGLPAEVMAMQQPGPLSPSAEAYVAPFLEKAGLVQAIDEAWLLLSVLVFAGLLLLLLARREPVHKG